MTEKAGQLPHIWKKKKEFTQQKSGSIEVDWEYCGLNLGATSMIWEK